MVHTTRCGRSFEWFSSSDNAPARGNAAFRVDRVGYPGVEEVEFEATYGRRRSSAAGLRIPENILAFSQVSGAGQEAVYAFNDHGSYTVDPIVSGEEEEGAEEQGLWDFGPDSQVWHTLTRVTMGMSLSAPPGWMIVEPINDIPVSLPNQGVRVTCVTSRLPECVLWGLLVGEASEPLNVTVVFDPFFREVGFSSALREEREIVESMTLQLEGVDSRFALPKRDALTWGVRNFRYPTRSNSTRSDAEALPGTVGVLEVGLAGLGALGTLGGDGTVLLSKLDVRDPLIVANTFDVFQTINTVAMYYLLFVAYLLFSNPVTWIDNDGKSWPDAVRITNAFSFASQLFCAAAALLVINFGNLGDLELNFVLWTSCSVSGTLAHLFGTCTQVLSGGSVFGGGWLIWKSTQRTSPRISLWRRMCTGPYRYMAIRSSSNDDSPTISFVLPNPLWWRFFTGTTAITTFMLLFVLYPDPQSTGQTNLAIFGIALLYVRSRMRDLSRASTKLTTRQFLCYVGLNGITLFYVITFAIATAVISFIVSLQPTTSTVIGFIVILCVFVTT